MIKNYLTVAFRNLINNKAFSIINILGLSFGLACSLLVGLWVLDETSKDKFHSKEIYHLMVHITQKDGSPLVWNNTPVVAAQILNESVPGVENAVVMTNPTTRVVMKDKINLEEVGVFADSMFFEVFDYPIIYGDKQEIMAGLNNIVISDKLALKLYNTTNVVGKTLELIDREKEDYVVTGVYSIPKNSTAHFQFVVPFSKYKIGRPWVENTSNFNDIIYVTLEDNTNPKEVSNKLTEVVHEKFGSDDDTKYEFLLYPYKNLYLKSDFQSWPNVTGRIQYVRLFTLVAIVIMVIACINFMNLSTAQASKRAKEVGVRKTVGARRGALIGQFLGESFLITIIATALALTVADILIPSFNLLVDKELSIPFGDGRFLMVLGGIILITGLVAGSYPALYLSSFEPATVLKGKIKSNNSMGGIRRLLVIFQFTLSIALIICTLVIHGQISYIKNIDLGVNRDHVMSHYLEIDAQQRKVYKQKLQEIPGVKNVAFSNFSPLMIYNSTNSVGWQGKTEAHDFYFHVIQTDQHFAPTFELNFISGNNFSDNISEKDTVGHFLLNEKAAELMGIEDPIGMEIAVWGTKGRVEGLLQNWNHETLYSPIEPVVVFYNPNTSRGFVKLTGENIESTIAEIDKIYQNFESERPFSYSFLDDEFNKTYKNVTTAGTLSNIFAVIAIFVSCLGLFGLASYMAEQRRKETGIRKVMGASVFSLTALFSKDFIKLVVVSFLLASPIAFYLTEHWLSEFQYHIKPSVWIFILSGGIALLIAIITVSFHTIKASLANPIKSLRYE